jgi:hypothetical protein
MNANAYCVISETTEDRFEEVDSLENAIRVARAVARERPAGDAVSIEHRGRVVRELVLLADGAVEEEEIPRCHDLAAHKTDESRAMR